MKRVMANHLSIFLRRMMATMVVKRLIPRMNPERRNVFAVVEKEMESRFLFWTYLTKQEIEKPSTVLTRGEAYAAAMAAIARWLRTT